MKAFILLSYRHAASIVDLTLSGRLIAFQKNGHRLTPSERKKVSRVLKAID